MDLDLKIFLKMYSSLFKSEPVFQARFQKKKNQFCVDNERWGTWGYVQDMDNVYWTLIKEQTLKFVLMKVYKGRIVTTAGTTNRMPVSNKLLSLRSK